MNLCERCGLIHDDTPDNCPAVMADTIKDLANQAAENGAMAVRMEQRAIDVEAKIAELADKAENLVIAIDMGWDLNGCVEDMKKAIDRAAKNDG